MGLPTPEANFPYGVTTIVQHLFSLLFSLSSETCEHVWHPLMLLEVDEIYLPERCARSLFQYSTVLPLIGDAQDLVQTLAGPTDHSINEH